MGLEIAHKRRGALFAAGAILLGTGVRVPLRASPQAAKSPTKASQSSFASEVRPSIIRYCGKCHAGTSPAGGLDLSKIKGAQQVQSDPGLWEKVSRQLATGAMPPKGAKQPTKSERQRLVSWIDTYLSQNCVLADPGQVTIRRLNREEYSRTIRDLLGVDFKASDTFPSDDVGYGFDNIADVLTISPLLMEKYLQAAEEIASKAIQVPESTVRKFEVDLLNSLDQARQGDDGDWVMFANSEVGTDVAIREPGAYVLRAVAFAQQAGPERAKMALGLDKNVLQTVEVAATRKQPQAYEVPITIKKPGRYRFFVRFTNDYYNPNAPDPKDRDRNLFLQTIEVLGPSGKAGSLTEAQKRMLSWAPSDLPRATRSRRILEQFLLRAYRRPTHPGEVDRLMKIVDLAEQNKDSFERGLQVAIQAALTSPNFLFRAEIDPRTPSKTGTAPVGQYEIASRLSYFIWSSMPDDTLLTLAGQGKLASPAVLEQQVRRMLADPKAKALTDVFAEQWLTLRKLDVVTPDPKHFPAFNDDLRRSMRTETLLLFDYVRVQDRSVLDYLGADYTFVNEALARHYRIPNVTGSDFVRVAQPTANRRGLLAHASILTLTSNPNRTSPVKRGKWVLEQLLGSPPPPPPPGAGNLIEGATSKLGLSVRQRLEAHRKNPECAGCHARLDPLGFGLENFDAVGAWRTEDDGAKIDSSGVLPDQTKFSGPAEMQRILMKRKDEFVRTLSEKMLTFALGRGLETYDKCALDDIARKVAKGNYRFSALVHAISTSDPFLRRRATGGKTTK